MQNQKRFKKKITLISGQFVPKSEKCEHLIVLAQNEGFKCFKFPRNGYHWTDITNIFHLTPIMWKTKYLFKIYHRKINVRGNYRILGVIELSVTLWKDDLTCWHTFLSSFSVYCGKGLEVWIVCKTQSVVVIFYLNFMPICTKIWNFFKIWGF